MYRTMRNEPQRQMDVSFIFRTGPLYAQEYSLLCPMGKRQCELQGWSGGFGKQKISRFCRELDLYFGLSSPQYGHCYDWPIQAPISDVIIFNPHFSLKIISTFIIVHLSKSNKVLLEILQVQGIFKETKSNNAICMTYISSMRCGSFSLC